MTSLKEAGTVRHTQVPGATISLILTVFNEAETIELLLESVAAQRLLPDEVVICDGGSRDGTVRQIRAFRARHPGRLPALRLLQVPGANISRGRNRAIQAAAGPIVAATDAGVRLDPGWLEELVRPFLQAETPGQPPPVAVAGFFLPQVDGLFQTAMAATVLPLAEDIDPQKFLPSSRSVAFLKTAWEQVGGYPEWLDYCEDLIFDLKLKEVQAEQADAFVYAPRAVVYFRPRTTLKAFWRQYYLYARGDGKADLWRKRHLIRYLTYLIALPLLGSLALTADRPPVAGMAALLLAVGIFAYCYRPWMRLGRLGHGLSRRQWLTAAAWVPLLRAVGDGAKMVGYPVGLWWRFRNRHRPEIHWRRRE